MVNLDRNVIDNIKKEIQQDKFYNSTTGNKGAENEAIMEVFLNTVFPNETIDRVDKDNQTVYGDLKVGDKYFEVKTGYGKKGNLRFFIDHRYNEVDIEKGLYGNERYIQSTTNNSLGFGHALNTKYDLISIVYDSQIVFIKPSTMRKLTTKGFTLSMENKKAEQWIWDRFIDDNDDFKMNASELYYIFEAWKKSDNRFYLQKYTDYRLNDYLELRIDASDYWKHKRKYHEEKGKITTVFIADLTRLFKTHDIPHLIVDYKKVRRLRRNDSNEIDNIRKDLLKLIEK